jgi:hypothetical protein
MTTSRPTRDVLVSRGGITVSSVNFALRRSIGTVTSLADQTQAQSPRPNRAAAVDAAFDANDPDTRLGAIDELDRQRARSRLRR